MLSIQISIFEYICWYFEYIYNTNHPKYFKCFYKINAVLTVRALVSSNKLTRGVIKLIMFKMYVFRMRKSIHFPFSYIHKKKNYYCAFYIQNVLTECVFSLAISKWTYRFNTLTVTARISIYTFLRWLSRRSGGFLLFVSSNFAFVKTKRMKF